MPPNIPTWANIAFPYRKAIACGCPERHVSACGSPERLFEHQPWSGAYAEIANALTFGGKNMAVMLGDPGTGKTQLAAAIMLRCIQRDGTAFSGVFTTARQMFDSIREQFGADGAKDVRPRYRDCRMLVVDEMSNCKWSEWESNEFISLVNSRYGRTNNLTVLISNHTLPQIAGQLGKAAWSRIEECGTVVEMNGWSFRNGGAA